MPSFSLFYFLLMKRFSAHSEGRKSRRGFGPFHCPGLEDVTHGHIPEGVLRGTLREGKGNEANESSRPQGQPPLCPRIWSRIPACYLRIENAEGYVLIAVYLFIYLYACYSHNTKSIKPNRMKFGGMIGYYPGTI